MSILPIVLLLAAVDPAPSVEFSTLSGEEQAGRLVQLTAQTLTVQLGTASKDVPLSQLVDVRFPQSAAENLARNELMQVDLVDGSRFTCSKLNITGRNASIESPQLGSLTIPLNMIGSVRLAGYSTKVDEEWKQSRLRELKQDLLVVRKGDLLDHLEGVIGDIDDTQVRFLLDGDEIPLNREKVFGVVYYRRNVQTSPSICKIELTGDNVIHAKSLRWDQGSLRALLTAGADVAIPAAEIVRLDFSGGKIAYLSQMEPERVNYTPFFDVTWEYHRDQNRDRELLRIGKKTYRRGLWIHSKTVLQYRLAGEFRRFQAVMGIDYPVAKNNLGDVQVIIRGDGKVLFDGYVMGVDDPQPLDLDVENVNFLEITVDFGKVFDDVSDHLVLGDARVIK